MIFYLNAVGFPVLLVEVEPPVAEQLAQVQPQHLGQLLLQSYYSGTSIVRTPLGPYQTVLIIDMSLVQRLCKPHPTIREAHLHH